MLLLIAATVYSVMGGMWTAEAEPAAEHRTAGLTFSAPPAVEEGLSATYTVVLDVEPKEQVTVTLKQVTNKDVTVDTSVSDGNQHTLLFTTSNWNEPQTVTVTVEEDEDAVDESAVIEHVASGTAKYAGVSSDLRMSITDNDSAGLQFSSSSVSVAEGGNATYTVKLTAQPTAEVTVTLTAADNTDVTVDTNSSADGRQTTLTFTPTGNNKWNSTQTVTVSADTDTVDDAARIAHVASGATEYASVNSDVRVRIADAHTTDDRPSAPPSGIATEVREPRPASVGSANDDGPAVSAVRKGDLTWNTIVLIGVAVAALVLVAVIAWAVKSKIGALAVSMVVAIGGVLIAVSDFDPNRVAAVAAPVTVLVAIISAVFGRSR